MKLDQVVGVTLPDAETRVERSAGTSLIYQTDWGVQVFTTERIKLDWWVNLGIIPAYKQVGEYRCAGFDDGAQWVEGMLPLYLAKDMPWLTPSFDDRIMRVLQIVRDRRHPDHAVWWERIARSHSPILHLPARFLLDHNYDVGLIYPDFKYGDFARWQGKIICVDPFHDIQMGHLLFAKPGRKRP